MKNTNQNNKKSKDNIKEKVIPFRLILAGTLTLIEVICIISVLIVLCVFIKFFYVLMIGVQIFCVVKIISSDDNPEYKIPWLLFVLVFEIVGFVLYFIFYSRKLSKRYYNRLKELNLSRYEKSDNDILNQLKVKDKNVYSQVKMLISLSNTHVFKDTKVEYLSSGEQMASRLIDDLSHAKKYIFMEYFIIKEGVFWSKILDMLKAKASVGVEVRVIYDDIGCMKTLSANYYKTLKDYKIKAVPFSRLKCISNGEFNNRNHRKIAVIDGVIGYTGGINIADEYVNLTTRLGHWKDSAVRLNGQGVWELTRLFYVDYEINFDRANAPEGYFYPKTQIEEKGLVVPFGDGPKPLYQRRVGKSVIKNMLQSAVKYAYITTPYLIIDNDTLESIENASLRGVDVKIILPRIPDKKLIFKISKSYYPRLLRAGVKIYEYEKGFIHAKNYIVDGKIAMTGTINLDYRSLVHHFEVGVLIYGAKCISIMEKDFLDTIEKSIRIEKNEMDLMSRAFCSVARIFAPLL